MRQASLQGVIEPRACPSAGGPALECGVRLSTRVIGLAGPKDVQANTAPTRANITIFLSEAAGKDGKCWFTQEGQKECGRKSVLVPAHPLPPSHQSAGLECKRGAGFDPWHAELRKPATWVPNVSTTPAQVARRHLEALHEERQLGERDAIVGSEAQVHHDGKGHVVGHPYHI